MSLLKKTFLSLARFYADYEYNRFSRSLNNVEQVQRKKLAELMGVAASTEYGRRHSLNAALPWERFNQSVPVTDYGDIAGLVMKQRALDLPVLSGSPCLYYRPSSGITEHVKWIPCTSLFLAETDAAALQLLVYFMKKNTKIFAGSHFWSLPWYPPHIRNSMKSALARGDEPSFMKKKIQSLYMTVPFEVSFIREYENYCLANLAYIAAQGDISLISVWNPALVLNLFDHMSLLRLELAEILRRGTWGDRSPSLNFLPCPQSDKGADVLQHWNGELTCDFFRELWPHMAMISAWDSGSSQVWIRELMKLFPGSDFQGKGLWTAEGVVTIPFENEYPLAVTSHFYEFLDLETGTIHPAWGLKKGQQVSPLISTGSGLFRYNLRDRIEVTGFIQQCPCFSYHGRVSGTDMAGERLNVPLAQKVLNEISARFSVTAISLFAIPHDDDDNRPYYLMLCDRGQNIYSEEQVAAFAEEILMGHLHYKFARELDQLAPLKTLMHPRARQLYQKIATDSQEVIGTMKIEPLVTWKRRELALNREELNLV